MSDKVKRAFAAFREQIFDEIFEDYAQSSDQWLDFVDYRKRAKARMAEVLGDHTQKLIRFIIDEHYENFSNPNK